MLCAAGQREMQAGRLLEAQIACERALTLAPDHAESLHLMGLLCARANQHDHALAWLARAIRQDPRAEYLASLGGALQAQGRHEEALQAFDKAVQIKPGDSSLWCSLGQALAQAKRPDEAILALGHALTLDPENWTAANACGLLLYGQSRFEDALACFTRCDELRGGHAPTLYARGRTLADLKRYPEALVELERAHVLDSRDADICNNIGLVLQALNRHHEALQALDNALALRPDFIEALNNKAALLGHAGRFDEALALLEVVLGLRPDHVPALTNTALWLTELHRLDEALAAYDRVGAIDPGNADALWNASFLHLLTGNFEAGWAAREARWKAQARQTTSYPDFTQPRWLGEPVAGKTVLIYAEEGLGDAIQFARYVPIVAAQGARVILVAASPVCSLLSGLPGVVECLAKPLSVRPDFDFHCPISSLPMIFATRLDSIPAAPYLPPAPPERVRVWEGRLGRRDRLRVGLVWSGSAGHKNDHNRSIPLDAFVGLLAADVSFVSLQKDLRPDDKAVLAARSDIVDLTEHLTDFVETSALVACLDLVISVDTSVAHLAAAHGRPTWILLPYTPDFRWLLDRDDSPWYPSARLFRQLEERSYAGVLDRVRRELGAMISASATR